MSGIWDYPVPPEPREIPEQDEDELYQDWKDRKLWDEYQESQPSA